MKKEIDCLFIGHNEMNFTEYEEAIKRMGINSGAYRDLNLNFIRYNNKPYTISDLFNIFYYQNDADSDAAHSNEKPFYISESFNAAISYLGTYLHTRGYTFDYVNSFQCSKGELIEKMEKNDYLTIAIITTLYVSELPLLEIMKFIKSYDQRAKVIIGGPFVSTRIRTLEAEELNYLFSSIIDADIYINSSQGEKTLVDIIHALKNNQSIDGINNIYFKKDKKIVSTPVLREDNKLSENMVDWRIFERNVGECEYVNLRTAISCPFSCSFCGFPQHAGKYQTAGVDAIEGELITLCKIKSLNSIHFVDDTFNIPKERFKKILKMIIRNQFEFKWHSYLRCQFIDKETVELMRDSGCEGVFLGLESGNNQILKAMNKATHVEHYLKGIELLRENGIVTFGDFIIGFPGETDETVRDTVEFIEKSGLDFYRAQLWYYEHITPIFKERDSYKIKGDGFEWSHVTMNHKQACDIIENIFSSVKVPVWIPQYNFDFDSIWHLKHRGMSIDGIKKFLERFNAAVNNKLSHSSPDDVSYNALENIRLACSRSDAA